MEDTKKLVIFDGNAVLHRAYHALPPLMNKKGQAINAAYGFVLVFLKALKDFKPDCIAAVFDFPGKNFRHSKYKLYKANRPKTPDDLSSQFPIVKDILSNFNVSIFEKEGFEADDIIGTISKMAPKKQAYPKIETVIVTGDRDILRLVDKNTKAYMLRKGVKDIVLYDEQMVKDKYGGLDPEQLTDFKALRGDPSDNIPGVFGIGEKTAITLVKEFGNIENLYEKIKGNFGIDSIGASLKKKLMDYEEQAFVSKMLAEIKIDVPIEFDMANCKWGEYNREKAVEGLEKYGFKSMVVRLSEYWDGKKGGEEVVKEKKGKKKKEAENKNNLRLW